MLIRIGEDTDLFQGDSEYGTPVAIREMLHNSKFADDTDEIDDADAGELSLRQCDSYVIPQILRGGRTLYGIERHRIKANY